MTFRPSDDVLDSLKDNKSPGFSESDAGTFAERFGNQNPENNFPLGNNISLDSVEGLNLGPVEEPKDLPDFSEIFKESEKNENVATPEVMTEETTPQPAENEPQLADEGQILDEEKHDNMDVDNKLTDEERAEIVSRIENSEHGILDLLVDEKRYNTIDQYKKIHHIAFRRGVFILMSVLGIFCGTFFQAHAKQTDNLSLGAGNVEKQANQGAIANEVIYQLIQEGVDIDMLVPYGSSSINGRFLQSKSNLAIYDGLVLPQTSSIEYKSDLFDLEKFSEKQSTREDIENLVEKLITDDAIYRRSANLSDTQGTKSRGQKVEGGLIKGFNLACLDTKKISDFFCDKFLYAFYDQGQYYDLSSYGKELLDLVQALKKENKDLEPVCNLVANYTLRSGVYSDDLTSVLTYCSRDELDDYRMLVNFIKAENSLLQPELSAEVFANSSLNAYKLLSAQQSVYKILDGTAVNKNFILSYLKYVQALINKDNGSNKYIDPIYKDMLYVFNTDVLYTKLLNKGGLSIEIKSTLDEIDNGHLHYGYSSLVSQLTTKNLAQGNSFSSSETSEKTIEEVFLQYYSMTDRLRIRKANLISDDKIRVQTEIFSDSVLSATNGETIKATVSLYMRDNVLYVESITIANQPKLSDILNIYVSNESASFYAMLTYIDDQIGFWYEHVSDEDVKWNMCDNISDRHDISLYTCDDNKIVLYKGDVEYNFTLVDGILDTFSIEDAELESIIKDKLSGVMIMKDNTSTIIKSIIDFEVEYSDTDNIEKKMQIVDQFRIHFKMVPNVYDIAGKNDEFLVEFRLGEFDLQAHYNVKTQILTKISYMACDQTLEIRNLTITLSVDNEAQLTEILNNPKVFFTQANQAAYKKYQRMCDQK